MKSTTEGCAQPIDDQGTLCNRECEYQFSKKLRDQGVPSRKYRYCSAHRRLRRIYGAKHKFAQRPIEVREEV